MISSGNAHLGGTSKGVAQNLVLTYYARLPAASQDVVPGSYADTVVLTVNF